MLEALPLRALEDPFCIVHQWAVNKIDKDIQTRKFPEHRVVHFCYVQGIIVLLQLERMKRNSKGHFRVLFLLN